MEANEFRKKFPKVCEKYNLLVDRDGPDVFALGDEDNKVIKVSANPYRKGFDILEEVQIFDEITKQNKKAYCMRYGNFQKAWNFVEAHIKVAVENYGKTVEHLQKLLEKERKGIHD